MSVLGSYLFKIQSILSKKRLIVKWCVKLKNQANIIIGLSLSDGAMIESNGEKLFAEAASKFSSNFIDVGSNRGEWTRIFTSGLQKRGAGMCIEPGKAVKNRLMETINAITNVDIELIPVALSDYDGDVDFWEYDASVYSGLIQTNGYGAAERHKVNVRRLDGLLSERQWSKVDFLKIDVEGFDFKVIKGCGSFLENGSIRVIQFEYGYNWMPVGDTLVAAIDYLQDRNYKLFYIKSDGLHAFDIEKIGGDFYWFANFAAIHGSVLNKYAEILR